MGLGHQLGFQGPCGHQVLQLKLGAPRPPFLLVLGTTPMSVFVRIRLFQVILDYI
jgi:hypothetical protein